jgi:outer membrane protein assembly factor BamB
MAGSLEKGANSNAESTEGERPLDWTVCGSPSRSIRQECSVKTAWPAWTSSRRAAALWMALAGPACVSGQVSVLTWHNDNTRAGQNLQETALTPANVNSSTFGRLFTITVDGKVDAEPLYVPSLVIPHRGSHNVLFVVTEHDSAYAFDADTGTPLWQVSLLAAGESTSDDRNCDEVTPEIGITSTPVIDPQMGPYGTMYVVAMSKNGTSYHQRLHALDLTTGAEEFSGPVEVQATYPGSGDGSVGGTLTFDPQQYKERAGLLLWNGTVYTSWASHCDSYPYTRFTML